MGKLYEYLAAIFMNCRGHLAESVDKVVFVAANLPGSALPFFGDVGVAAYDEADTTLCKRYHPVNKLWRDSTLWCGESFPGCGSDKSVFEGEAIDDGFCEQVVCGIHD